MKQKRQQWLAVLILALLFAAQSVAVFQIYASRYLGGNDFYPRWAGGRALFLEGRDPYDPALTAEIAAVLDPDNHQTNSFSFAYPLHVLFVMAPLSLLPYGWAYAIWMVCVQWLAILLVGVLLARQGWRPSPLGALGFMLAATFFYPISRSIILGQFTVHITLFVALCLLALQQQRDGWAGAFLAATSIKPQMVIFVAPLLLLWAARHRRWRFFAGFFGGGALLFVASLALFPRWPLSFLEDLPRYSSQAGGRAPLYILCSQVLGIDAIWPRYLLGAILVGAMLLAWQQAITRSSSHGGNKARLESALHWSIVVGLLVPFQTGSTGQVLLAIPFVTWLAALRHSQGRSAAILATALVVSLPWALFVITYSGESPLMFLFLPLLALVILVVIEIAGWRATGTERAGTAAEGAPSP